jgi:uncharacterized protein YbjT (DUF2867 family)
MSDPMGMVLVLGATGETGRRTVKILRGKNIAVRAMARTEESVNGVDELHTPGVSLLVRALDEAGLAEAMQGVSAVISTIGSRMGQTPEMLEEVEHLAVARAAQAAKAAGVGHFVYCTSMGVETPEMIPFLTAILKGKRRGELALMEVGIPYTIVRPGGLVNDPSLGGIEIARTLRPTGMATISRDDVAEVLVQAVLQPNARGKIAEIIGKADGISANSPDLFAGL